MKTESIYSEFAIGRHQPLLLTYARDLKAGKDVGKLYSKKRGGNASGML